MSARTPSKWQRGLSFTVALALALSNGPLPSTGWAAQAVPVPAPAGTDAARPSPALVSIPHSLGEVVESWQPDGQAPEALIVHIQDMHTHAQAQRHISGLIGYLHEQLGVQLVAVEGADGLCDTRPYAELPDPPTTERVARLFVQEGLFTGAEYYAITHPDDATLWGVEDKDVYLQHLETYKTGVRSHASAQASLDTLRAALGRLRTSLYPPALRELLMLRNAYERSTEESAFPPYLKELQRLAQAARLDLSSYGQLKTAAAAEELRVRLDPSAVEKERIQLLKALRRRLRAEEQAELSALTEKLSAQRVAEVRYYERLSQLAAAHGITLLPETGTASARSLTDMLLALSGFRRREYGELRRYVAYLRLAAQVRSGAMVKELRALEEAVESAYLTTKQQRALAHLLKRLDLMDGLFRAGLSPDEYDGYRKDHSAFTPEALWEAIERTLGRQSVITRAELERLTASLTSQERFYELARRRDEALARNTIRQLHAQSVPAAILIVGGFHTPGITRQLREQGIAYVVVAPAVTEPANETGYHERLQDVLPTLDELTRKFDRQALIPGLATDPDLNPEKYAATHYDFLALYLRGGIRRFHASLKSFIDRVLAWFKSHPSLGLTLTVAGDDALVLSGHGEQMTLHPEEAARRWPQAPASSQTGLKDGREHRDIISPANQTGVPRIPEQVPNLLSAGPVSMLIQALARELAQEDSDVAQRRRELIAEREGPANYGQLSLEAHRAFLRELGARANTHGLAVYYPFGGFDVVTPFATVPDATDVFAMGATPFGTMEDLVRFLREGLAFDRAGGEYRGFDQEFDLQKTMRDNKVSGLGGLAIARIMSFLGGRIEGMQFFVIENDGRLRFLSPEEAKGADHSAVIEFLDPETGIKKRYWYLRHDVADADPGFSRLVEQLTFQTLFIKGAPGLWNSPRVNRQKVIRETLDPARRNNAQVITDERLDADIRRGPRGGQQPIWADGQIPLFIPLEAKQWFGYSLPGGYVYYGPAEWLIGSGTSRAPARFQAELRKDSPFYAAAPVWRGRARVTIPDLRDTIAMENVQAGRWAVDIRGVRWQLDPGFRDRALGMSEGALLALLQQALDAHGQTAAASLAAQLDRPLTLVLDDQGPTPAGNHVGDGVIRLNRWLFTLPPRDRDAALMVSLYHELGHELDPAATEETLTARDLALTQRLLSAQELGGYLAALDTELRGGAYLAGLWRLMPTQGVAAANTPVHQALWRAENLLNTGRAAEAREQLEALLNRLREAEHVGAMGEYAPFTIEQLPMAIAYASMLLERVEAASGIRPPQASGTPAADTEQIKQADETGREPRGSRTVTVDEEHVKEVDWRETDTVPDRVGAYAAPTEGATTTGKTGSWTGPRREGEQIQYVYRKPNRGEAYYLGRIQQAIREMTGPGVTTARRLELFLGVAWPQFLIALADDAGTRAVKEAAGRAVDLLEDPALIRSLHEVIALSHRVGRDRGRLFELSRAIRGNAFLHRHGFYLAIETISRTRVGTNQRVNLLSSVAHAVDEIEDGYQVIQPGGRPGAETQLLYLGRRIDRINEELPGLGFMFTGDSYGVVVKGTIRRQAYQLLLPHLFNRPFAGSDSTVHPINAAIRQAIQRDYPLNPTPAQIEAILESRYRSTAIHERQHVEDGIRRVFTAYSPIGRRVWDETSAYLASMAYGDAPFTDLVDVVEIFLSYRIGLAGLADFDRIYEQATRNILLRLTEALGVSLTAEQLDAAPLEAGRNILQAALGLTPGELKQVARQIHLRVLSWEERVQPQPRVTPPPTWQPDVWPAGPSAPRETLWRLMLESVPSVGPWVWAWDMLNVLRASWTPGKSIRSIQAVLLLLAGVLVLQMSPRLAERFSRFWGGLRQPTRVTATVTPPVGESREPQVQSGTLGTAAPSFEQPPGTAPSIKLDAGRYHFQFPDAFAKIPSTYRSQPGQSFNDIGAELFATRQGDTYPYPDVYYLIADNILSTINADADRLRAGEELHVRARYAPKDRQAEEELLRVHGRAWYERRRDALQRAIERERTRPSAYTPEIQRRLWERVAQRGIAQGDLRARQPILAEIERELGPGVKFRRDDMVRIFQEELDLIGQVLQGPSGRSSGKPAHFQAELKAGSARKGAISRQGQTDVQRILSDVDNTSTPVPFVPLLEPILLRVDHQLEEFVSADALGDALREAVDRLKSVDPAVLGLLNDGLLRQRLPPRIAVLDTSTSLFENHLADGLVGVNRALLEAYRAGRMTERQLHVALAVGLLHELRHEALGPDADHASVEAAFTQTDIRLTRRLLGAAEDVRAYVDAVGRLVDARGYLEELRALEAEERPSTRGIGIDSRPIDAKLLQEPYVRHDMAVKTVINPDNQPLRAVYGGAGVDLSNFLLSTNAETGYFVGRYFDVTAADVEDLLRNREAYRRAVPGYQRGKYLAGYGFTDILNSKEAVLAGLAVELESMGVDLTSVRVDADGAHPRIRFEWAYAGVVPRPRAITLFDADVTTPAAYPAALVEALQKPFDVYYQRAGHEIPLAYRVGAASFIASLHERMRPGGYFVTDDYSANPQAIQSRRFPAFLELGPEFPVALQEVPVPMTEEIRDAIVRMKLAELSQIQRDRYEAEGGSRHPALNYGWHVTIRQKEPAKAPVPAGGGGGGEADHYDRRFAAVIRQEATEPQPNDLEPYLAREGLSDYAALKPLFTPLITEALLDDAALRPVFLQVLPDEALGPLVTDREDVKALLAAHSVFLIGSPEVANRLAAQGQRVIVAVTDRFSRSTMYPLHTVANGRQAYVPLADGTWLGLKGSGQYAALDQPPHYRDPRGSEGVFAGHLGLASLREIHSAIRGTPALQDRGFITLLGYRQLYRLPDGQGNLVEASGLKDSEGEPLEPVLIFNRVRSPHRLIKFPQLLETDPGLERLRRRLSRTLNRLGELPADTTLSPDTLIARIARELGRTEALKQNRGQFKFTLHSQDLTIAGEEADLEELLPYEEYVAVVKKEFASRMEDAELLFDHRLSIDGVAEKLLTLRDMLEYAQKSDQQEVFFPNPKAVLDAFMDSYISSLETRYLKLWDEIRANGVPKAIAKVVEAVKLERFSPPPGAPESPTEVERRDEIVKELWERVQQELRRRTPSEPAGAEGGMGPAALAGRSFGGLIAQRFGSSRHVSFADLGSGPTGEFGRNLRRIFESRGVAVGDDSISVDNALLDPQAVAQGWVRHADVLSEFERNAVGLADGSKDLVFVNNLVNRELLRPAMTVLRPSGALIITFAESDVQNSSTWISGTQAFVQQVASEDARYAYQILAVDKPADYPASNQETGTPYPLAGTMFIVTKAAKTTAVSPAGTPGTPGGAAGGVAPASSTAAVGAWTGSQLEPAAEQQGWIAQVLAVISDTLFPQRAMNRRFDAVMGRLREGIPAGYRVQEIRREPASGMMRIGVYAGDTVVEGEPLVGFLEFTVDRRMNVSQAHLYLNVNPRAEVMRQGLGTAMAAVLGPLVSVGGTLEFNIAEPVTLGQLNAGAGLPETDDPLPALSAVLRDDPALGRRLLDAFAQTPLGKLLARAGFRAERIASGDRVVRVRAVKVGAIPASDTKRDRVSDTGTVQSVTPLPSAPQGSYPTVDPSHEHVRALLRNAMNYFAPDNKITDPPSGYPFEGWNHEPERGLDLRALTQLTAIGLWVEVLADIIAGHTKNPFVTREQAQQMLIRVMKSLRQDQDDPQLGDRGLLVNFMDLENGTRRPPLGEEAQKRTFTSEEEGGFGKARGELIWQALVKRGWITPLNDDEAAINRIQGYGEKFEGALAQFKEDKKAIMEMLDVRHVTVVFGDNANLSASVAAAIGALLRPDIHDHPTIRELRETMEAFLDQQQEGYRYLYDETAGMMRFGWNKTTAKWMGGPGAQGKWRVAYCDYLGNEFRGPTMFVVVRYNLPQSIITNLAFKIKSYPIDGKQVFTLGLWNGSAFQMLWPILHWPELRNPAWRTIFQNFMDIELASVRNRLPSFPSESYTGKGTQYTGSIGIPEIAVATDPLITDLAPLYPLGPGYMVEPKEIEELLKVNQPVIELLSTDEHGPWEGWNAAQKEAIKIQTTAHTLSLILGFVGTGPDNMVRYLESKGLLEGLESLYAPGEKVNLWESPGVVRKGNPGNGKIIVSIPRETGVNLSNGTLSIRYHAEGPSDAIIGFDRKEARPAGVGIIPNEAFVRFNDTHGEEHVIQMPLPATPALAGIKEIVIVFPEGGKEGGKPVPVDVAITGFAFEPYEAALEAPATVSDTSTGDRGPSGGEAGTKSEGTGERAGPPKPSGGDLTSGRQGPPTERRAMDEQAFEKSRALFGRQPTSHGTRRRQGSVAGNGSTSPAVRTKENEPFMVLDARAVPPRMTRLRYVAADQLTTDQLATAARSLREWPPADYDDQVAWLLAKLEQAVEQLSKGEDPRVREGLASYRFALSEGGAVEGYGRLEYPALIPQLEAPQLNIVEIRRENRDQTRFRGVGQELMLAALGEMLTLRTTPGSPIKLERLEERTQSLLERVFGPGIVDAERNAWLTEDQVRRLVYLQHERVQGYLDEFSASSTSPGAAPQPTQEGPEAVRRQENAALQVVPPSILEEGVLLQLARRRIEELPTSVALGGSQGFQLVEEARDESDGLMRQYVLKGRQGDSLGTFDLTAVPHGIRLDGMAEESLHGTGLAAALLAELRRRVGEAVPFVGEPGDFLDHNRERLGALGIGPIVIPSPHSASSSLVRPAATASGISAASAAIADHDIATVGHAQVVMIGGGSGEGEPLEQRALTPASKAALLVAMEREFRDVAGDALEPTVYSEFRAAAERAMAQAPDREAAMRQIRRMIDEAGDRTPRQITDFLRSQFVEQAQPVPAEPETPVAAEPAPPEPSTTEAGQGAGVEEHRAGGRPRTMREVARALPDNGQVELKGPEGMSRVSKAELLQLIDQITVIYVKGQWILSERSMRLERPAPEAKSEAAAQSTIPSLLLRPQSLPEKERLQQRVRELDERFGRWDPVLAATLIRRSLRDLRAALAAAIKPQRITTRFVRETLHGSLEPFVIELIRRLDADPAGTLAAVDEVSRQLKQDPVHLASPHTLEALARYQDGQETLAEIDARELFAHVWLQQDTSLEGLLHALAAQTPDLHQQVAGRFQEARRVIAEISQWDFAHRFDQASGIRVVRGMSSLPASYRPEQQVVIPRDVFFSYTPGHAATFVSNLNDALVVADVPLDSIQQTSWAFFPDGRVYEPEIKVAGSVTIRQILRMDTVEHFMEWVAFKRRHDAQLRGLSGLEPRDFRNTEEEGQEQFGELMAREFQQAAQAAGAATANVPAVLRAAVLRAVETSPDYPTAVGRLRAMMKRAPFQAPWEMNNFLRSQFAESATTPMGPSAPRDKGAGTPKP